MSTITAQSIIDRASTLIQDATNVRWPQEEILKYLNDGQREVVLMKPEASVINASVLLTASATKQTIPAAGIMLIDVTRNMGSAGSTAGDAVRVVSREVLDAQRTSWHSDAAVGKIKHYMFDSRDPKTFYVYPQAPATAWYVELVYSSSPGDIASAADGAHTGTLNIDDIYANALLDYVLYRSYSKDAEYAQNGQLAVAHYQAFANSLGVKTQNEIARNPNAIINAGTGLAGKR